MIWAMEAKKLHRLGNHKIIAALTAADGSTIELAARAQHRTALLGPYTEAGGTRGEAPEAVHLR
jgi:hypothetical protein